MTDRRNLDDLSDEELNELIADLELAWERAVSVLMARKRGDELLIACGQAEQGNRRARPRARRGSGVSLWLDRV